MTTPDLVAQSIFCEHIRQELQGVVSLIGIMPDNIAISPSTADLPPVEGQVAVIPSLSVYTRVRFPLDRQPRSDIVVQFVSPSGQMIYEAPVERDFILESFSEAQQQGNEYLLVIQQANLANFPVIELGRYVVSVMYDGERFFSGALRISAP